jgi:hypothetical protein
VHEFTATQCAAPVYAAKASLERLGLRARRDPSRAQCFQHRTLVVGINAWLMEGKKGRPDRSSAVYCQSGVCIDFHVNCIILGPLPAWVNAATLSSVRTPFRTALLALLAVAIAAFSFLYRFNTLGGPLGGFDNDHFPQLVRFDGDARWRSGRSVTLRMRSCAHYGPRRLIHCRHWHSGFSADRFAPKRC